jgi:bifunctional N-acetylglucosamine-1-phosphate-uridyltransferase/glucosamine-1-phosphate-acetyltransferase GlmU-like protein
LSRPTAGLAPRAKIAPFIEYRQTHRKRTMDVEHINAIGNSLADLTRRTQELRGYL